MNAIILEDDRVLTIKRKTNPWKGMYGLPGGHIEENENEIDALKREVREETGFHIEVEDSDFLGISNALSYGDKNFEVVFYKARIVGGEKSMQVDEVEEIQYLTINEFVENLKAFHLSSDDVQDILKYVKLA